MVNISWRRVYLRIFVGGVVGAGLLIQPAAAQDQPLVVRHGDTAALPTEAAIAPTSGAPDAFHIAGGASLPGDIANRPGRIDDRPRVLHSGNSEALFAAPAALVAGSIPSPALKPDWMVAHYINVGQGNATLLEFSCGVALIDTGGQGQPSRGQLLDYLNKVFARRADLSRKIALVVLTHPHSDHTFGASVITALGTQGFTIGSVVTNAGTSGSGWAGQKLLRDFATQNHIPLTTVNNDDIVRSDGLTNDTIDPLKCQPVAPDIRVLWGTDNHGHSWATNENNDSVVVRVDFGKSSFLFTGDLEDAAQPEFLQSYVRNPDIINADVYEVGHHGSKNGTTEPLLRAIKPQIAVISSGNPAKEEPGYSAYNFGHPNRVTIQLLSDPSFGVTMTRPSVNVAVGIAGKSPRPGSPPPTYETESVSKAIFDTGWDGDVEIAASADGQKIVQTK